MNDTENKQEVNESKRQSPSVGSFITLIVLNIVMLVALFFGFQTWPGNPVAVMVEGGRQLMTTPQPPATDPLTCYITADGGSVNPSALQLRCGDDAVVDYTITRDGNTPQITVNNEHIRGWEAGTTSVGTSRDGSLIVRTKLTNGDTTFSYSRDLADGPESTDIQRTGPWPANEIPTPETR